MVRFMSETSQERRKVLPTVFLPKSSSFFESLFCPSTTNTYFQTLVRLFLFFAWKIENIFQTVSWQGHLKETVTRRLINETRPKIINLTKASSDETLQKSLVNCDLSPANYFTRYTTALFKYGWQQKWLEHKKVL